MSPAVPRRLLRRSIWDYHLARRLYGHLLRNRRAQLLGSRPREKECLNVGCGGNPHEDFVNLDYRWNPRVDLCWDITRGIPLERGSLRGIFTEHCLEHLSLEDTYRVLVEFRELLRPEGTVRIVVPDGEFYLDLYQKSKSESGVTFPGGPAPPHDDSETGITPMLIVNRAFRAFGHLFAYDYRTMELLLRRAGFVEIRKESFLHGRDDILLIDYEKRALGSLYVEGTRPASEDPRIGSVPSFDVASLIAYLEGGAA